jgi:hypothetical protein
MQINYKNWLPNEKQALLLTLLITFIYELLLSFQGFDLCDEGSALCVYQQIFTTPSSVEYQFVYYLGGVVGGLWNSLFGFGGILSFRILTVFVLLLTIYFTWLTFRKFISPVVIPIAVSLVLLMNNVGIMVFFHNHLTALLVAVSAYFILKGLISGRSRNLFWGFLFCGVNCFARIPNITLLALGFLLIINYLYDRNQKNLWRNSLVGISGFLTGIGSVVLLLLLLGHWEVFINSVFTNLLSKGTNVDSPHNFSKLLSAYITNYKMIFTSLTIFVFAQSFFPFIYHLCKNKWAKIIILLSYCFIIIAFSLFAFNNEKYYAIILFPLIISCFVDVKNKPVILLNVASLIILFFLPIGSDFGISNMGYFCVWPATFASVFHVFRFIRRKIREKNNSYLLFFSIFYLLFVTYGLYVVSRNAYYDRGSRLEKRYRANNSKMTVFTSKDKAEAIDMLLSELNKQVKKGDYLFCFESLPMIHYLTETKPYIGNPWVWVYDSDSFKSHLDKSVATIPLPVVLRQKCQPIGGYWTVQADTSDTSDDAKKAYAYFYKKESIAYFEKFLVNNNYKIVWENELFAIYLHP